MRLSSIWLASVIGVAGCMPLSAPRAADSVSQTLAPIERLGRWDGERFIALGEREIGEGTVRVLIHGWAPGFGAALAANPRLRAWEAETVDGQRFEPWLEALAEALAGADPSATILAYSWVDDAATSANPFAQRRAFSYTDLHGSMLVEALGRVLAPTFSESGGQVHLIGHSYGSRVATLAALESSPPPVHLTLFDAPDAPLTRFTGAAAGLSELLQRLPLGIGPGRIFVDNYVSGVGRAYRFDPGLSPIVDVMLAPPHAPFAYRQRHLYPMEFYAQTAHSSVGLAWCPTRGPSPEPACYAQVYGELRLARGCADVP